MLHGKEVNPNGYHEINPRFGITAGESLQKSSMVVRRSTAESIGSSFIPSPAEEGYMNRAAVLSLDCLEIRAEVAASHLCLAPYQLMSSAM
jgi:hypothetical protein